MINRLFEIAARFNRLQQRLEFKVVATVLALVSIGALAGLASGDVVAWFPEAVAENLISSSVIAALAIVGMVWLGLTLSAVFIGLVSLPLWFIFKATHQDLWAQIALGIGSLLILFLLLLQLARMMLSSPVGPVAVARLLLDEAIRMKLALVFIVLLVIYIPFLATQLDDQERLQYRLQTFLSYGTGVSYALLALMTVFLSTATVAFEQRDKQIYQIVSKPLGRLHYLLGKWLGVVVLNGILLLMTGGAIFWFTQYLRTQPPIDDFDRMAVTEQVLTSRVGVRPTVPDFRVQAQQLAEKQWQDVSEQRDLNNDGNIDDIDKGIYIANQGNGMLSAAQAEMLSIPPGEWRPYTFNNVYPISKRMKGTVHLGEESPLAVPSLIQSPMDLSVHNEDGSVVYVLGGQYQLGFNEKETLLYFLPADAQKDFPNPLVEGQTVYVDYFPENAMTLRFKINSGQDLPSVSLPITVWIPSINSEMGDITIPQKVVLVQTQSILIPAGVVRPDHSVTLRIANGDMQTGEIYDATITIPWDGLELMYKVDTFEWNYFRAMLIIWLKLSFLAMLGISAATFASFPVACLLAFTIFFGAESAPFLAASLENFDKVDPVTQQRYYFNTVIWEIASGMQMLLKQYGTVRPTQNLIEGRTVSWRTVWQTFFWISLLWTGLTALVGWLVFRARQLAIYSGHA